MPSALLLNPGRPLWPSQEPKHDAQWKGILHGLGRRDVVPHDTALISRCQDGVASGVPAVVADWRLWLLHQPVHGPPLRDELINEMLCIQPAEVRAPQMQADRS